MIKGFDLKTLDPQLSMLSNLIKNTTITLF